MGILLSILIGLFGLGIILFLVLAWAARGNTESHGWLMLAVLVAILNIGLILLRSYL